MAEVAGFEPTNAGTKTQCLTAWLHPIINLYKYIICKVNKNYNYKNMGIIVL